ncbi:hypothetical protein [Bacteroides congonensis]|uniref:hypothetical protein n=1 Tax=Bacteroides congonensis TaxID=1871006 RepID=UPI0018989FA8|nr:hypothetical protein [Bacteroides congonensis]
MKRLLICVFLFIIALSAIAQNESVQRILVSAEVGKGILIGKTNLSPLGVDYRNEYSSGYSLNVKALYLLDKQIGVGLKGKIFCTTGNYLIDGETKYADNIEISYIAPQLEIRRHLKKTFLISLTCGIGYMHYKSVSANEIKMKTTSNSYAVNMDFMFEYEMLKRLSLRGGISCLAANNFNKNRITINNEKSTVKQEKWNRIQMYRIDCLLGLVYSF